MKGKKREIIKIHICGEGFVEVLHYGDKSFPTYRMGRICKIVGKDTVALHFGEEFVEKDRFDSGRWLLPMWGIAVHLGKRESLIPSP